MALTSLQSLLSPEARLLLLTAGGSGNDAAIAAAVRQPLDWSKLSWLAEWERATGVVWRRLHAVSPREIPPDVALGWERLTMVADFHALYLQERFLTTVRALTDEGIEVILLKGAALAHSAYASFTDRPMGDVDLLIDPDRAEDAWRIATSLGWNWDRTMYPEVSYRDHHHLPPLTDPQRVGAKLELHTALASFGHPFALGFDAVRRASRPLRVGDRDVMILDDDHQVIHLSVHLAWSHILSFGAWRSFRDIGAVLNGGRVDWTRVEHAARAHGATSCCYWTLRLASQLSGIDVPAQALAELRAPTPWGLHGVVERHLASQLFATERVCPSQKVRRWLWSAAIRPGRLRLGEGRPWDIDQVTSPGKGKPIPFASKIASHVENFAQWAHYLRLLAFPK